MNTKLSHLFKSVAAISMIGGLLTGCLSESDFKPTLDDNGKPLEVKLFNEIQQLPTTRVNDEGFCNADKVGIFVVNYVNGEPGTLVNEGNQGDNVKFTLEESTGEWKPETPIYYMDNTTKVDVFGYYPYCDLIEINAQPFEIAKDQSRDAENEKLGGYEASDFLWAKAVGISPTSSKVVLLYNHIMAGVNVTLVEGEGFAEGEFATLEKSAIVTNTKRKTIIDFATGVVTAIGDVPTTGTIPYKKGEDFRAIVAPQTVAANTPLFKLTVDGLPYVFSKAKDFTFAPGKLHQFSIQINKKETGGVEFKVLGESITAWESETFTHDGEAREYVIIHCETPGGLQDAIVASGKDCTKLKNMKITGKVNANDFFFMRDKMTQLQAVNMKETRIEAVGSYKENEIPEKAFDGKTSLIKFIFPENIIAINKRAFQNSSLAGSLQIPDGVKIIGDDAFKGCKFTGTLTLSENLEEIHNWAFENQSFIGDLIIPEKVRSIGASAFTNNSFTSLSLPEGLQVIGNQAFSGNKSMRGDLRIPSQIKTLELQTFASCPFDGSLYLPEGLQRIEDSVFSFCKFKNELVLPSTLISIGARAFSGCDFSGKMNLPESLVYIGETAFGSNKRITGVLEIPKDIISISTNAFYECTSLQGVVFGKNLSNISSGAFQNCYQLNSIVSNAQTPPTVASTAFNGVAKASFIVEVPEAAVENYRTAPGWREFTSISAHHDFSISRAKFRALNASDSKKLLLKAPSGSAWTVESCPDWVTVSPMSGTGKTEVTITINEMTPDQAATVTYEQMNDAGKYVNVSFNGRRGEVVFLLDGKNYRNQPVSHVIET